MFSCLKSVICLAISVLVVLCVAVPISLRAGPLFAAENATASPGEFESLCLTGLCGNVWALAVYNGQLYAGGEFTRADGQPTLFIARWDGSQWHDVGGGTNHYVWALTVYDGKLIAGGPFDTAGGVAVNYIAAWDGTSWQPLGSGVDRKPGVEEMCVYNGDLIVSGGFDYAGGVYARNIARWNGTSWSALGTGLNGGSMTVYDGCLIVTGYAQGKLGRWDGSVWSEMDAPVNGWVHRMAVYNNELIIAGFFPTFGDTLNPTITNNIAAWDGAAWHPLGAGMEQNGTGSNAFVGALFVFGNDLIAGGNFTSADSIPANFIARWDGASWNALGGGMGGGDYGDRWVSALTEYNGDLIAGGLFTTADSIIVNHVTRWDGSEWHPVTVSSGMPFTFEIDRSHSLAEEYETVVAVTKIAGSDNMYGFDLTIAYNDTDGVLTNVTPGPLFDIPGPYEWEFFEYTQESGLIRIVASAEDLLDPHHSVETNVPNGTKLFSLNFTALNSHSNGIRFVPLEFYWRSCADNVIVPDSFGIGLVISDSVYDAGRINVTDNNAGLPGYAGAPDECQSGGSVVRYLNLYGGMITIFPIDSIDMRGDININGVNYELADMVMFWNFFFSGFDAFGQHIEASIAASDINADGLPLRFDDYIYLHRIICGDTLPISKNLPIIDTAVFVQDVANNTITVQHPDTLAGVFMRVEGKIIPSILIDTAIISWYYLYDGNETRIMIFPDIQQGCGTGFVGGPLFSYTGYGRLVNPSPGYWGSDTQQAADYENSWFVTPVEFTGGYNGQTAMELDTLSAVGARTAPDNEGFIYLDSLDGYTVADIDQASLRINDSLTPMAVEVLSSHPEYPGEVLKITVNLRDFILGYGDLPDTAGLVYEISGTFTDDVPFVSLGSVVIVAGQATIPVPEGWPTIHAAYTAAVNGDIIAVSPGVYTGDGNRDLLLSGKSVHITSLFGPDVTTIDCQGSELEQHYAVRFFDSLLTDTITLEGFTIRNAFTGGGGAVGVDDATVVIRNCVFVDNHSTGNGGAVYCWNASPVIENCAFIINHADYGGAISCNEGSSPHLTNCTFYGNWAAGKGGSIYFVQSAPAVENCIFAFGTGGAAIDAGGTYEEPAITCTDIFGNVGGDWVGPIAGKLGISGNISLDPLFCDWYQGDFHLSSQSPCLPINNGCRVQMGAFGHGCGLFCGDAGNNLHVDIGDAVFLIAYLYRSGPPPEYLAAADVNRNGTADIGDAVAIINYIFRGGPELECGMR